MDVDIDTRHGHKLSGRSKQNTLYQSQNHPTTKDASISLCVCALENRTCGTQSVICLKKRNSNYQINL